MGKRERGREIKGKRTKDNIFEFIEYMKSIKQSVH